MHCIKDKDYFIMQPAHNRKRHHIVFRYDCKALAHKHPALKVPPLRGYHTGTPYLLYGLQPAGTYHAGTVDRKIPSPVDTTGSD